MQSNALSFLSYFYGRNFHAEKLSQDEKRILWHLFSRMPFLVKFHGTTFMNGIQTIIVRLLLDVN